MSGLDRGKATDGPSKDGLGAAQQDSPWGGTEPVPAPQDGDNLVPGPAEKVPVAAVVAPRAPNPWRHSRPRRSAQPSRRGATSRGLVAVLRRLGVGGLSALTARWGGWLAGALVLAGLGTTSLHAVGPHDQALVSTLGVWGEAHGPGLVVTWPAPISSVRIDDVTTMRHLTPPDSRGEHLMMTRDGGLVAVVYDVRWHIRDLRRYALGLAAPDATLRQAADDALRTAVAQSDAAQAMGTSRETVGHRAAALLQAMLDGYQSGIAIDGLDLRRADPPVRVADALRAVSAARNEALSELDQAKNWSRQWITHAQGEAGAFDEVYAQYRNAPDITRRQMYYATMERVMAQSDKVIVDAPGTITQLPPLSPPAAEPPQHSARGGDGH